MYNIKKRVSFCSNENMLLKIAKKRFDPNKKKVRKQIKKSLYDNITY